MSGIVLGIQECILSKPVKDDHPASQATLLIMKFNIGITKDFCNRAD